MAEQKLKGKVAIIDGGAKDLGDLISRTLAADSAESRQTTCTISRL